MCGNCQIMDRIIECKCCHEIPEVANKSIGCDDGNMQVPNFIVYHQGFITGYLVQYVLETVWYQYTQQYAENAYDGPPHKLETYCISSACKMVLGHYWERNEVFCQPMLSCVFVHISHHPA